MPTIKKLDRNKLCHVYNVGAAVKYGLEESIILYHIAHWIEQYEGDKDHTFEKLTWVYFRPIDLKTKFPEFSKDQLKRIFISLVKQGAIKKGRFNKKAYDKTNWYTILDEDFYTNPSANLHLAKRKIARPIPIKNSDKKENYQKKAAGRLTSNAEYKKGGRLKNETF